MYERILVPLDGSKRAEAILSHVQALCSGTKSKVFLLTALEHKLYVSAEGLQSQADTDDLEHRMESANAYLDRLANELHQMDIQAECKVTYGPAVDVIIDEANEINANLIAIASHGRSGLERVFYGSIAAGLLQSVNRPLLVVRSRGFKPDRTIQWGKDAI